MKNITCIIACILTLQQLAYSQDTLWRKGGIAGINFNQTSLNNWAAGGENALAANALLSMYANYKKDRASWDNSIDLAYGIIKQGTEKMRKNEDKIDLTSKYGYDVTKKGKLYYAALINFKSQFAEGYNFPNDSVVISKFAAPAFITVALGIDYKPIESMSFFLSPLTGKMTIVNDKFLADAGAYGVNPAEFDANNVKTKDGSMNRLEIGAYFNMKYQKEVGKNVNLTTKLDLFSNYTEEPQNIDVNWEVLIAMKVNKLLTTTLSTQLIYDDNVIKRTQFKEVFGIGIAYKFSGYGIK